MDGADPALVVTRRCWDELGLNSTELVSEKFIIPRNVVPGVAPISTGHQAER